VTLSAFDGQAKVRINENEPRRECSTELLTGETLFWKLAANVRNGGKLPPR
jgi:hypothetical protein